METEEVPLKFEKIEAENLLKGDIILHQGQLWQCASKHMELFLNLDSRQQQEIKGVPLLKVRKLQLIPKEWKVSQNRVTLKGQQLGLGHVHEIEIEGMRAFPEMEVVRLQLAKGRKVEYKVVLCETEVRNKYLMVAIQFL